MSDDGLDEPFDTNVPTPASRDGGRVVRPAGPWTPTTHALLRHLHEVGFTACPRLSGTASMSTARRS